QYGFNAARQRGSHRIMQNGRTRRRLRYRCHYMMRLGEARCPELLDSRVGNQDIARPGTEREAEEPTSAEQGRLTRDPAARRSRAALDDDAARSLAPDRTHRQARFTSHFAELVQG